MNAPPRWVVRTGGQTGADRAALDAAIRLGRTYRGWCPAGGWAEDFPDPPGLLAVYPLLTPTPSADPAQRTAWNVRDSAATLALTRGPLAGSPGTAFTKVLAELVFVRPLLVVDVGDPAAAAAVANWLETLAVGGRPGELNVAGPRESEAPGIYRTAGGLLTAALGRIG